MPAEFIHLHVHTNYSLLDGACRVGELVKRAAELSFPALAMTDHGNIFGAVEFYETCLKAKIKPIIGVEAYMAPKGRTDRSATGIKDSNYHLVLLARDTEGYRNLLQLVSIGYLEGFYYKPRIDKEMLAKYGAGLIALTSCLKGAANFHLMQGQTEAARKEVGDLADILGHDNVYVELQNHGIAQEDKMRPELLRLAKDLGLKTVATNDVHYLDAKHAGSHDALMAIQTQTTIDDPHRLRYERPEFYLKAPDQMKALFAETPEAIANTLEIAERCNVSLELNKTHLPWFEPPAGKTQEQFLRELCDQGLRRHYPEITDVLRARLEHEFNVIKQAGYVSYFLIVWDFVRFAKERGIPVGPGRGSAAGSLVSYCLNITELDPLKYDLLFERFLNPARVTMPDIDIDFCYERRPEVIEYVVQKYGKTNVAQIITFGTMQAKAVVRDVGRAMKMTYTECDRLAKLIPNELDITLKAALERVAELKQLYTENEQIKTLIDTATHLEGLTRHASTHAAGVTIADKPLVEYMPLFKSSDGQITSGFDMTSLEHLGLLKMDMLGLRNLTVIDQALRWIKRTRGIDVDLGALPLDDQATYELLARSETMGVFQLESGGMRDLLRKIKASQIEDLIAVLALYRPGPIGSGMLDEFIKRKHGQIPIKYEHPKLETALKPTYGVIVYQEQVMRIASDLAGFTLAQADLLRRAMGKKIAEVMEAQRKAFVDGCVNNNVPEKIGTRVFELIEYFAGYGFNKSHSAAYAIISYRTAYLKAHYPVEYMAALLTSEMGNADKLVPYLDEAKRMGLKVLPPDVNESEAAITVVDDKTLRCGLGIIKNVGMGAVESIIEARKAHGRFGQIEELCEYIDLRLANRKVLESLIKAGACDSIARSRAGMMAKLDQSLEEAAVRQRDKQRGQFTLFGATGGDSQATSGTTSTAGTGSGETPAPAARSRDWPESQKLAFEKALLGFYVSGHPLARYERLLKTLSTTSSQQILAQGDGAYVRMGGMLTQVKLTTTKKTNEQMAICVLEDLEGDVEMLVFPGVYAQLAPALKPSSIVFVDGRVGKREEQPKLLAQQVVPLDDGLGRLIKSLELTLPATLERPGLERLKELMGRFPGSLSVMLTLNVPGEAPMRMRLAEGHKIDPRPELLEELGRLLGPESVLITPTQPAQPERLDKPWQRMVKGNPFNGTN